MLPLPREQRNLPELKKDVWFYTYVGILVFIGVVMVNEKLTVKKKRK